MNPDVVDIGIGVLSGCIARGVGRGNVGELPIGNGGIACVGGNSIIGAIVEIDLKVVGRHLEIDAIIRGKFTVGGPSFGEQAVVRGIFGVGQVDQKHRHGDSDRCIDIGAICDFDVLLACGVELQRSLPRLIPEGAGNANGIIHQLPFIGTLSDGGGIFGGAIFFGEGVMHHRLSGE